MATSRLYPQVHEGWVGSAPYRRYQVKRNHGQSTLAISLPEHRFMDLPHDARHQWLRSARQRVESGHA